MLINRSHETTGVPSLLDSELVLGRAQWDASRRRLGVSLAIGRGPTAVLELYDLSGRRVAHRSLEGLAPGAHDTSLEVPVSLRSGVYFLRLRQGEGKAVRNVRVLL